MRTTGFERISELLQPHSPPCVSIYLPTHRHRPDTAQDPIRYRNLVRDAERRLQAAFPGPASDAIVERLEEQGRDRPFWDHRTDGLALLASPERFAVVDLQRTVPETVVVSDSFHVKPLLRALQSADRFDVLALTRHEASVYEGDRDTLDALEVPGAPLTFAELVDADRDDVERHVTVAYGATGGAARGAARFHGHGDPDAAADADTVRFFRAVDRVVHQRVSARSGLPLVLVALDEHHATFASVSRNPYLLREGVRVDPAALGLEALRARAWEVLEPLHRGRLRELAERFGSARASGAGSADVAEVAAAARAGRVAVALVEADRVVPGRLGAATGSVEVGGGARADAADLLDDVAEEVLRNGGEVLVVSAERMPVTTGVAAIYRY